MAHLDYEPLHSFANAQNISYNQLCVAVRQSTDSYQKTISEQAARISELEKDAARLDWLVEDDAHIVKHNGRFVVRWHQLNEQQSDWSRDFRESIDAAIAAMKEKS